MDSIGVMDLDAMSLYELKATIKLLEHSLEEKDKQINFLTNVIDNLTGIENSMYLPGDTDK